ncbi:MAG: nuclear transport factor 2 family protein [Nitrospirota bacterium]
MHVQPLTPRYGRLWLRSWLFICCLSSGLVGSLAAAKEPLDPEATLRLIVQANADRDLPTMAKYMSHDADAVGYTIDGHKYVGWTALAADMHTEFTSVAKLELPITYLQFWRKSDIAWFAMELDYVRYLNATDLTQRMVLPLRETGVMERRDGTWILVTWHESTRQPDTGMGIALADPGAVVRRVSDNQAPGPNGTDLSGEWEVTEIEDNKKYVATLDTHGNGPYTWQGGQFATTSFNDRRWQGTWKQSGNDREGAFEVVISEDGTEAKGIWWYVRVGTRDNIPPRQHGGTYLWKRLTPPPTAP